MALKILVVGRPDSGQKDTVELLTGSAHTPSDWAGYIIEHEFDIKYLGKIGAHIWTDEYQDPSEWVVQFCSDAAMEVREAIDLVLYTFSGTIDHELAEFRASCRRATALAISPKDISNSDEDRLKELGFDFLTLEELPESLGGIFYDLQSKSGSAERILSEDTDESEADDELDLENANDDLDDPGDLDDILDRLRAARVSTTMSNQEKRSLANHLASKLIQ